MHTEKDLQKDPQSGKMRFLVIILEWEYVFIFDAEKNGQETVIRKTVREAYIQNNEWVRLYLAAVFREKREFNRIAGNMREKYLGGQIEIFNYDEVILTGAASKDLDLFWCVCRVLGRIPLCAERKNAGGRAARAMKMRDKALLLWASLLYKKLDPEQKADLRKMTGKYLHVLLGKNLSLIREAGKEYEETLDWLETDLWMDET